MVLALPPGFWYDTVDSTQEEARSLVASGRIKGTAFVVAAHQSQGRGTHGRAWSSPAGAGIYLTVVHTAPADEGFNLTPIYTLSAGVAAAQAIFHATQLNVRLKPINDLYFDGKKLGGILVESDVQQGAITALMTGIGINLHRAEHKLDRPLIKPVSLEEILPPEAFAALNWEVLVETLVAKVCFNHGLVFQGQHGQIRRLWESCKLEGTDLPDF